MIKFKLNNQVYEAELVSFRDLQLVRHGEAKYPYSCRENAFIGPDGYGATIRLGNDFYKVYRLKDSGKLIAENVSGFPFVYYDGIKNLEPGSVNTIVNDSGSWVQVDYKLLKDRSKKIKDMIMDFGKELGIDFTTNTYAVLRNLVSEFENHGTCNGKDNVHIIYDNMKNTCAKADTIIVGELL